jgi:hypothetical protein
MESTRAQGRRRSERAARSVVLVDPELHAAISAMARRNGRTIMGQVRLIIEEALRREREQNRRAGDAGERGVA